MYRYTLLKQDGTTEVLQESPKVKGLKFFYDHLNCSTVELIPKDYYEYEGDSKDWHLWGDEEARFNSDHQRNPQFKVLEDMNGSKWDVVGNVILEEKI